MYEIEQTEAQKVIETVKEHPENSCSLELYVYKIKKKKKTNLYKSFWGQIYGSNQNTNTSSISEDVPMVLDDRKPKNAHKNYSDNQNKQSF